MEFATIISGILAGLAYSLTGFAKSSGESFDWVKFARTLLIGAFAGAGMALFKTDLESAHLFLINLGLVPIVDNLIKAAWRKIFKKDIKKK